MAGGVGVQDGIVHDAMSAGVILNSTLVLMPPSYDKWTESTPLPKGLLSPKIVSVDNRILVIGDYLFYTYIVFIKLDDMMCPLNEGILLFWIFLDLFWPF